MIYLDNAASTPLFKECLETLFSCYREDFANPSAAHLLGRNISKNIEKIRKKFLSKLKLDDLYNIIFTSSATESNNQVINFLLSQGKKRIAYCGSDHPSVTKFLIEEGIRPVNSINKTNFADYDAVFLTHVNSSSGEITDVIELCKKIRKQNSQIYIHIDGAQALCKIPPIMNQIDFDSYSISAHKIGGPKGIAGLIFKKDNMLPLLRGGGQEMGLRSSTISSPLIEGFYKSFCISWDKYQSEIENIIKINSNLKSYIMSQCPDVIFPFKNTSPFILTCIIPKIPSDVLLRHLEAKGIYVSSSSACSSKIKGKSETFLALGIDEKFHKNVLRISFFYQNTLQDSSRFGEELIETISEIKEILL